MSEKTPIWPASATTPTAREISVLKLPKDPSETQARALPHYVFEGRTRVQQQSAQSQFMVDG